MLGIGLIGTGFMGKAHAFAYRAALAAFPDIPAPRLEIIADVDDVIAAKAAHQYGFARSTSSWQSLVRDPAVDVVSITTPNTFHREMVLAPQESMFTAKNRSLPVWLTPRLWLKQPNGQAWLPRLASTT
jgi:predicted dehydrogenase